MKAITTTQLLKDLNPQLFTGAVGSIRIFSQLPKSFFSPTHHQGQRTDGYHTLSNTIHQADGFFDVVTPVIDDAIEKLGDIFFNVDHFTYPIVAKTAQEQANYAQAQLDADNASTFFNNRRADGLLYLDRFDAYVYRQVVNGQITKAQAVAGLNFFHDAIMPLQRGYFELANTRVTALNTANPDLVALKNKIITELTAYIANE